MKPLDEVIEIFEKVVKHDYVWFDEKTALMTIETLTDTLQYLREYRDECNNIVNVHDDYIQLRNEMQDELSGMNPPLSWQELQQMKGKPVWIEMDGYKPNWGIVMNQDKRNGRLMLCGYDEVEIRMEINEEGEGTGWKAYRKERK